eukprot:GILJ01051133.1.p1 GENE.GILJ01051133.1~~GILJ01051133.1.p1  ORF type:complete len:117 (-),score=8.21 GILJ01051133.1:19-369(-)
MDRAESHGHHMYVVMIRNTRSDFIHALLKFRRLWLADDAADTVGPKMKSVDGGGGVCACCCWLTSCPYRPDETEEEEAPIALAVTVSLRVNSVCLRSGVKLLLLLLFILFALLRLS